MGCLYMLTSPSGNRYIGITKFTAEKRFKDHVYSAGCARRRNTPLSNAIRKYGEDTFGINTLVVADDWAYLQELERRAVKAYDTISPNGYNLTAGGEGVLDMAPEARRRSVRRYPPRLAQELRAERGGIRPCDSGNDGIEGESSNRVGQTQGHLRNNEGARRWSRLRQRPGQTQ